MSFFFFFSSRFIYYFISFVFFFFFSGVKDKKKVSDIMRFGNLVAKQEISVLTLTFLRTNFSFRTRPVSVNVCVGICSIFYVLWLLEVNRLNFFVDFLGARKVALFASLKIEYERTHKIDINQLLDIC